MTRVLLVRHGESVWNDADRVAGWAPVALTDTGRREATAVGRFLATEYAVERVLTSDIRRAGDTAAHLADAVGAPVTERAAWRERDWGALQGLPSGSLLDRFPELDLLEDEEAATARPMGGESWQDVQTRTHDALDALADHGGTTAVVSHFGPILLAVGRAYDESIETALTDRRVGTGSVTELSHDDGTWHVDALGRQPTGQTELGGQCPAVDRSEPNSRFRYSFPLANDDSMAGDADTRARAQAYCADYLEKCTITRTADGDTLVGLPEPYVVPNREFFEEMYYWDAYFSMLGLRVLDRVQVARSMVENCFHLLDRYGFVPNANRTYYESRSQPPFLAPMVDLVYGATGDDEWLARAVEYVADEYERYWTEPPHLAGETGLSRYYDASGEHEHAEDESGWDLTSRFCQRANDFVPVDLNSYLYGYERHLVDAHERLGNGDRAATWRRRASERRERVVEHCWDESTGLFFDYDFRREEHSPVESLAAYVPLWTGLATDRQADRLAANLDRFEFPGGLVTTTDDHGMPERQWNYPEGWAPLQWQTTEGLTAYGYDEAASRVRRKWLTLCEQVYDETGVFWENYDVVDPGVGGSDRRYEIQSGFGWTCAVYLAFLAREQGGTVA